MKIYRTTASEVSGGEIKVGDKMILGKYTATCQRIAPPALLVGAYTSRVQMLEPTAIFLLDQYLDKRYQMDNKNTNEKGYKGSLLRISLNADLFTDPNFRGVWNELIPFRGGNLFRIPTCIEMFGYDSDGGFEEIREYGSEQWELMKVWKPGDAHFVLSTDTFEVHGIYENRMAKQDHMTAKGWLMNKHEGYPNYFSCIGIDGNLAVADFRDYLGVRPVFQIKAKIE